MNYIKHLTGFFERVIIEKTLNPTHISLYMALFQFWNCNRFRNPISISRDEVMRISKISSKATYHKCLKNLHALRYIDYQPSYNPFKGSHVIMFNFSEDLKPLSKSERKLKNEQLSEPVNEQVLNKSWTSSETSSEQALVPSINNINKTNNLNIENVLNLETQVQKIGDLENSKFKINISEKEKSCEKKEKDVTSTIENVKAYFLEQHFPELEAIKFFNYFSSNGWLVGGKTPMVDWHAAAQNWILNAPKFVSNEQQPNRGKYLNTATDKDYSEPL